MTNLAPSSQPNKTAVLAEILNGMDRSMISDRFMCYTTLVKQLESRLQSKSRSRDYLDGSHLAD